MTAIRVAIDGPAGVGKSTAAKALAARLGLQYVDTGAMYRAVAVIARRVAADLEDETSLSALAVALSFQFPFVDGEQKVVVDGEDLSEAIRTPQASMDASTVSRHPAVRRALVELQRAMASEGGVVMEGRDIGTVVVPDAELKVFLDADARVRGARRVGDLRARGEDPDLAEVIADIRRRDEQDRTREASPLRAAEDAVVLDTTDLSPTAVVDRLQALADAVSRIR